MLASALNLCPREQSEGDYLCDLCATAHDQFTTCKTCAATYCQRCGKAGDTCPRCGIGVAIQRVATAAFALRTRVMVMHGRVWGAYQRGPMFQDGLDLQSVNDPLNHAARLTDPIWRRFQAVRAAAAPELPPGGWDRPSLPVPPDLPPADPATFRESIQRVTNAANAQLTEMERVRASLESLMAELTAAEQQVRELVEALEQTVEATRAGLDDENGEGD